MKRIGIFFFHVLIFFSCTSDYSEDVLTIPLAKTLVNSNIQNNFDFEYRFIELETSDSVLIGDMPIIRCIEHGCILLKSQDYIYFFDLENGSFLSKLDKKGNGPYEYSSISDVIYSEKDKSLYVYDIRRNRIIKYSESLDPLGEVANDSISSIQMNKNNQFIVSYNQYHKGKFLVGIYDENFEHLASFIENSYNGNTNVNLRRINSISIFNGEPYIYIPDTLYHLTSKGAEPVLVIGKGNYKIPIEVESDAGRKDERNKYIWGDYGYLVGDYFFMSFIYNKNIYFDIWETKRNELKARRTIKSYQELVGIPFNINGETIYIWPSFVSYNKIYCLLDFEQTLRLFPDYDTDNNPIVIEIMFR